MSGFFKILVSVALASVVFSGCSRLAPVYDVSQSPIEIKKGKTSEDVYQAIKRAGVGLGWVITKKRDGLAEGKLSLRKHLAVVEIPYSTSSYSINYKSSVELNYNDAKKTIHKNYNGWISNLDNAIQVQLSTLVD